MTLQNTNLVYSDKHQTAFFFGEIGQTSNWKVWNKPAGCKFVNIFVLGGGGGGGGGQSCSGNANYLGGGAGGGGGGMFSLFVPAMFIPDTLYINCGQGGLGGSGDYYDGTTTTTSAVSGSSGGNTYVCAYPDTNVGNILCLGTSGIGGGVAGAYIDTNVSAMAPGGAGGIIPLTTIFPFRTIGFPSIARGSSGSNGCKTFYTGITQYPLGGTTVLNGTTAFSTGGCGGDAVRGDASNPNISGRVGGFTNSAGTGITEFPSYILTTVDTRPKNVNGLNSWNNYSNFNSMGSLTNFLVGLPFLSSGGYGGYFTVSPSSATNGSEGGNGGFGSGGGGGGAVAAGNNPSQVHQGGSGGSGGPGLVYIECLI
jgi:hypothetical protein